MALKMEKTDGLGLFSEHLKHACPAIVNDLSLFFTACFRHGYLPKCIRDCYCTCSKTWKGCLM